MGRLANGLAMGQERLRVVKGDSKDSFISRESSSIWAVITKIPAT